VSSQQQHLDTQVVAYAMKGRWDGMLAGSCISSIVANELLLVQSQNPSQADLYIPLLSTRHFPGSLTVRSRRRHRPFSKRLSDSIIIDFGNEFASIVEYNNLSIAKLINEDLDDLLVAAIGHFDKQKRKLLARRFRFIVENGIRCRPLQRADVELAFHLLGEFRRAHNLKQNFRNTWNDLLIVSSAINSNARLITEDNELSRFAAELSGVSPSPADRFIEIPFARTDAQKKRSSRESKGYINVGWRVQFDRVQSSGPN